MNSDRQIHYTQLKKVDMELAYLAALTVEGLKPMSRWEKDLPSEKLAPLVSLGLVCRRIPRRVTSGANLVETVFSWSSSLLSVYETRFANQPVDKSAATQRWEGYLFGFPPCCIDHYIRQPYRPNDLLQADQEVLFHWACPGCAITPSLVPAYRSILEFVQTC